MTLGKKIDNIRRYLVSDAIDRHQTGIGLAFPVPRLVHGRR